MFTAKEAKQITIESTPGVIEQEMASIQSRIADFAKRGFNETWFDEGEISQAAVNALRASGFIVKMPNIIRNVILVSWGHV